MSDDDAAEMLAAARRQAAKLAGLPPALCPRTLEDAYKLQDEVARRLGPVGGWKLGAEPDGSIRVAPIPAACVHRQRAAPPIAAPARLEVEFAVLIGADLPAGPYGPAELDAAIASAHAVIEVLEHRFTAREAVSDLTFLADGNGNGHVIIGDEIANWRSLDLAALDVRLNGASGPAGAGATQVLALLAALANHAAIHAGGLQAGQIVITGARAGPGLVGAGAAVGSVNGAGVRLVVGAPAGGQSPV